MAKRKKGSGGARPGAGKPATTDPKITIRLGVKQSKIERVGGIEMIQQICHAAIDDFNPI